ncbi:MAG: hypothetical protein IH835_01560, partial [Proteobacteria bacterium]|nr:hypothetical protein [Pseudomonadota bacterium]
MISLTILVIILAGIFQVFDSQHKAVIVQQEVAEAQQNVRVALQIIGDELVQVTDFETAEASDVKFKADIDGDGYKECVRYYRSTTTIVRELFNPSGRACIASDSADSTLTMVENVLNSAEGLEFTYRDETDTALPTPVSK